ncbi:MAG: hypothetical protein E3J72_06985 [Planctomycetota bacterium]|nr:MAG: hypothetical protein E3J72_06985 [Planctomycetota bacterium]
MQKLRVVFRVILVSAGVLSVTLGGAVPAFSGAGGASPGQEINAGVNTPGGNEPVRPIQPKKQLLSEEELQELTEISAQSSNLGDMTGGDHHADIHLHAEEVILIILGVLLIILILIIIF